MTGELKLALLGKPQFSLNGQRLTVDQLSVKGMALLSYLAVTRQEHSRVALAGLLWGDIPEERARANLRLTLNKLRPYVDAYLLTSRQGVAFNFEQPHWLDTAELEQLIASAAGRSDASPAETSPLHTALALYRGDFLEDFHLPSAPDFELWLLPERERWQRLALAVLARLAEIAEQEQAWAAGIALTRRMLALEPWQEEAHRRLMILLARAGQRSTALAQFELCRQQLAEALGVEPAAETVDLYNHIKNGRFSQATAEPALPRSTAIRSSEAQGATEAGLIPFVARDAELAKLSEALATAQAGQGQLRFIIGSAGRGKTALTQAFARQAHAAAPELISLYGHCNAHTGLGDPYLPFRQALERLTGATPVGLGQTVWPALVEFAPDLIGSFLPGSALLDRAAVAAPDSEPWFKRLSELVVKNSQADLEQQRLFGQYTALLKAVAARQPLLFIIDDLHWLDPSSAALLFHLSREVRDSRIMIIGTYRPDELSAAGAAERHPLATILGELKRQHGDIGLDLGRLPSLQERQFVEAYLDTQPNHFSAKFRETLFLHTDGHALFTVELLRALAEQGHIYRDERGHWHDRAEIDWQILPAKVEGVIESRIARLDPTLRAVLTVASVEGETFTAEVIGQALDVDAGRLVQRLSGELAKQHRLVTAQALEWAGSQRLSLYRFRHYLFQHYLYHRLDDLERAHWHDAVGRALERLYGHDTEQVAMKLAHHFERAGLAEKATGYLLQAGRRASRLSAYQEAVAYLRRGLALLNALPESPAVNQRELDLQVALGVALMHLEGYAAPAVKQAYTRAQALCEKMGATAQLFPVLYGLWAFYHVRAEHQAARELGESWLRLAERQSDPTPRLTGHRVLGVSLLHLGQPLAARPHLEQCLALYNPAQHQALAFEYGHDPGVAGGVLLAWTLWLLGYPEQALRHHQAALRLARQLAHPFSVAFALVHGAMLHQMRRETEAAQTHAEAAVAICQQHDFSFWLTGGNFFRGWSLNEPQPGEMAQRLSRQLQAQHATTGMTLWQTYYPALLAQSWQQAGQFSPGLALLDRALEVAGHSGEQFWLAELYRLQGELRQHAAPPGRAQAEAEPWFRQALATARQQGALSLELRAAVNLVRLHPSQETHRKLAEIYGRFTEGFDTPDLREAKALLQKGPER